MFVQKTFTRRRPNVHKVLYVVTEAFVTRFTRDQGYAVAFIEFGQRVASAWASCTLPNNGGWGLLQVRETPAEKSYAYPTSTL